MDYAKTIVMVVGAGLLLLLLVRQESFFYTGDLINVRVGCDDNGRGNVDSISGVFIKSPIKDDGNAKRYAMRNEGGGKLIVQLAKGEGI